MEALNSSDPVFLETCHRWLLFNCHCKDCCQTEDTCEYGKVCSYGKTTFAHVRGCSRTECSFPRCDLIKSILCHHQACQDNSCQVCAPVRKYQARIKAPPPPPPPLQFPYAVEMLSPGSASSPMQCSSEQNQSPRLPQPQTHPQPSSQTQKRSSCQAELDSVQSQTASQQQFAAERHQAHQAQAAGMLFAARHREHNRNVCASLSRSSWTLDTTSGSGTSSGGCTMANAPSGSVEAAVELQALQLEKASQQQQQQQSQANSCTAKASVSCAHQSAPAPLQEHPGSCSSGGVAGGSHLSPVGEGTQATPVLQQQQPHVLQPPQPPHHYQQCGPNTLAVLLQPSTQRHLLQQHHHHQQQQGAAVTPQPQGATQLQHQLAGQQQQPLPVAQMHQPMYGTLQFVAPAAFSSAAQLQIQQQLQQQQPFGNAVAAATGNGGLSAAGAIGLQTGPPTYMSLPYGTMMQQSMQLCPPAPGLSYTFVHHHYGPASQAAGVLVPSSQQQQLQFQLQQQLFQQHQLQMPSQQHGASGLVFGSGAHMPTGPGFFLGAMPGLAPMSLAGGGSAALDSSGGVNPVATAPWGAHPHQPSGLQRPILSAQQQQQHLQEQFPAAAAGSSSVTSVLPAPQLAGAT